MTQAVGNKATIAMFEETTQGVTPGSPTLYTLGAVEKTGITLKETVEKLVSNARTTTRGKSSSRPGNFDVSGSLPFELPLQGIGRLLKQAIGPATTYRAATVTSGAIANVRVLYVHTSTPTGDGSLALSSGSLTWTPQGGSAGASVSVATPGRYAIQGGSVNQTLYVEVTGAASGGPATVNVSTAYRTHRIVRGALPTSFGIEIGYPDIGVYHVFNGLRIDKMNLKISNQGFIKGQLDLVGMSMTASGSSLGVATGVAHVPYAHHEAVLTEDGVAARFTDLSFDLMNDHDKIRVAGSRSLDALIEKQGDLSGSATYLFEDASIVDRIINGTAISQRIRFSTGSYASEIYLPVAKFYGDAGPGIKTDGGLMVDTSAEYEPDTTLGTDIELLLTTQETSI